jgi:hypothetical protein
MMTLIISYLTAHVFISRPPGAVHLARGRAAQILGEMSEQRSVKEHGGRAESSNSKITCGGGSSILTERLLEVTAESRRERVA